MFHSVSMFIETKRRKFGREKRQHEKFNWTGKMLMIVIMYNEPILAVLNSCDINCFGFYGFFKLVIFRRQ